MKILFVFWVLAFSAHEAFAKPVKIYRCQQTDGSVVIQDRRCMVTDLQKSKKSRPVKPPQSKKLSKPKQPKQTIRPKQTKKPSVTKSIQPKNSNTSNAHSNRSPYFTFGWDRFIPVNWLLKKIETLTYEQILISRTQFTGLNDFKQGVKLSVYANTMQTSRLDAFAQALVLYHQIRDNKSYQLIDSQFKAHPKYKVFNIKYSNSNQQMMLTEFYIDETNNDLFVVTIQADIARWQSNQQMANLIIQQL